MPTAIDDEVRACRRAEDLPQHSDRAYRTLFEDNPQPMWVYDRETLSFLAVNDAAIAHYGYTRNEFLTRTIDDIRPGADFDDLLKDLTKLDRLNRSGPWRHRKNDGTVIWVLITSYRQQFMGREARFVMAEDVTEQLAQQEHLRHCALHDELTGLPNRTLIVDRLRRALARATHSHAGLAVLFVDLDRFKQINDVYGHTAGDQVLREFGCRLLTSLRSAETVGRFGSDKFVILVENVSCEAEATAIAAGAEGALAVPFRVADGEVFITASVGVVLSLADRDADEILRDAETAMYRAKERGGAHYEIFDEARRTKAIARREMATALRHAITRDELRLVYQPEIDMRSGGCVGVEALMRWEHPTCGLLAPAAFIPTAEQTGQIKDLGRWALHEACRQLAAWRDNGHEIEMVSVNVAAGELNQPEFVAHVSEVLDQFRIGASSLCLELTETALVEDPDGAAVTLDTLHRLGVQLSIDDFGTGYSPLVYLRDYPFDYVKLDQLFVRGIDNNSADEAIVAGVIALAHAVGVRVVAEGVETHVHAAKLRAMNCDLAQGYLWSPPVSGIDVPARLKRLKVSIETVR